MQLQLAWRNIWRNPRRTLIILTAVVIGAWTMLFFGALSRGMAESMLTNSINNLTGHIQIQKQGYRDDPVVENRINDPTPIKALLDQDLPPEAKWAFRIEVNGVASNARNSKGVTIVGIDPDREPDLSFYGQSVTEGRALRPDDAHGILVGQGLLDSMDTKPGRKIVLMTQGADKETASRAFKIRGVYRAELEATEKRYVFVTLPAARKLLGVKNAVTSACIRLPEREQVGPMAETLGKHLPKGLSLLTWEDMLPLLTGYLSMFDSFMFLWYLVIFVAMGFGIVNTTLMAVLERTREFGLLKALGMKPARIVRGVLTECLFLLLVGLVAGNALGFLTVLVLSGGIDLSFMAEGSQYFGMSHLIFPKLMARDVVAANGVILVLGLLVSLYPALKAGRITPVEAMAQT